LSDTNDLLFDESSIQVDKFALGLDKVDNTSDADKPISTATQTALNLKQQLLTPGGIVKNTNSCSILLGAKVRGVQGLNGITVGETPELLTISAPDYSQHISTVNLRTDAISGNTEQVSINDSVKITGILTVDTIDANQANEVTVQGDLAIGSALLVDSIRTSNATEISVTDNVKISGYITTTGIATFNSDIMASTGNCIMKNIKSVGSAGVSVLTSLNALVAKFYDNGTIQLNGATTVNGNLVATGSANCVNWCVGVIDGGLGTVQSTYGIKTFTFAKLATGRYSITMATAHVRGVHYCVLCSSSAFSTSILGGSQTSTTFVIECRDNLNAFVDKKVYFTII